MTLRVNSFPLHILNLRFCSPIIDLMNFGQYNYDDYRFIFILVTPPGYLCKSADFLRLFICANSWQQTPTEKDAQAQLHDRPRTCF